MMHLLECKQKPMLCVADAEVSQDEVINMNKP